MFNKINNVCREISAYIGYPTCTAPIQYVNLCFLLQAAEPQTVLPLPSSAGGSKIDVKSNLNPASVPFVPASMKAVAASALGGGGPPPPPVVQQVTVSCPPPPPPAQSAAAMAMAAAASESDLEDSDIKSPISLVHECALKRNLTVSFEIVKEVGPPHMRTFVMKCVMGEVSTLGEGNGKRVRENYNFLLKWYTRKRFHLMFKTSFVSYTAEVIFRTATFSNEVI